MTPVKTRPRARILPSLTFAGGVTVDMRIERVEEPTVFAYTWRLPDLPEDDPRRTYVEFTLDPAGDGTLLRVVETGFAQLPLDTRRETYDSHSEGWARELAELAPAQRVFRRGAVAGCGAGNSRDPR